MKKIILLVLLIGGLTFAQAQRSKVVSAFNYAKPKYNELDKAMKAIDEAKDHSKTQDDAKTWYYRGMIYQRIYQDSSFHHLHENPLKEAMASFEKALELDEKERYEKEILNYFNIALQQGLNQGIIFLRAEKPQKSFEMFEQLIKSAKLEETFSIEELDLGLYYFAAIAAQQAKMPEKANEYYKKSIKVGHEVSRSYLLMAQNYKNMEDTAQYVATLKDGLENAEDNKNIMLLLVDYFQKAGKLQEALQYMQKAIKADPENVSLYFAMGNVYSELGKPEKAEESYNTAINIDPDNVDVLFNLGTLFFNTGAEYRNEANELDLDEKEAYDSLTNRSIEMFKKAANFFERAHKVAPKDKDVLKTLKKIYMQLRREEGTKEKLEEIEKKLEQL